MKFSQLNKEINVLGIVISIIFLIGASWFYYTSIKHPYKISIEDVATVTLHHSGRPDREVNAEEARNIVKWYNAMGSFKANDTLAGATPDGIIGIKLKDGKSITINGLGQEGRNLEFQASGMKYPYFATQNDLRQLIDSIGGP